MDQIYVRERQTISSGGACEFGSCMCHNKDAIDEEGNWKSPHKFNFLKKNQSAVSGLCKARNRV